MTILLQELSLLQSICLTWLFLSSIYLLYLTFKTLNDILNENENYKDLRP